MQAIDSSMSAHNPHIGDGIGMFLLYNASADWILPYFARQIKLTTFQELNSTTKTHRHKPDKMLCQVYLATPPHKKFPFTTQSNLHVNPPSCVFIISITSIFNIKNSFLALSILDHTHPYYVLQSNTKAVLQGYGNHLEFGTREIEGLV